MPSILFGRCVVSMCVAIGPSVAVACSPFIEEHPTSSSASLRPHTTAFEQCTVDETMYRRVVTSWLQDGRGGSAGITSLALGRAVVFPWLSQHIADSALASPGWAARVANAKPGERDTLAANVLRDPALLRRLAAPFEGTGYVVRSVSYEKVLFGRADEHASRPDAGATLVPFDAQLWLRLSPRD